MGMARKRRYNSASTSAAPPRKRAAGASTASTIKVGLPRELILDILSRLPVKSVSRFRCVCKSWDAMFYDPIFLREHANSTPRKLAHCKILMKMWQRSTNGAIQSLSLPTPLCCDKSKTTTSQANYQDPPPHLPIECEGKDVSVRVVGCCNGVVCLTVLRGRFHRFETIIYVWNPLTNDSIRLPYSFSTRQSKFNSNSHVNVLGFGFDNSISEFKLVRLFVDYSKHPKMRWASLRVEVYGMWEGSRKRISDFPNGLYPVGPGIFLNGVLHWPAFLNNNNNKTKKRWVIVALDIAKETFQQVPLPEEDEDRNNNNINVGLGLRSGLGWDDVKLYSVGEVLCFMSSHDDVWIMKEYGMKESWIKVVTIRNLPLSVMNPRRPSFPVYYSEINGDLLMIYRGKLVLYDTKQDSFQDIVGINHNFSPISCHAYVESLFTPKVIMRLGGESYQQHPRLKKISRDEDTGLNTWSKSLMRQRG